MSLYLHPRGNIHHDEGNCPIPKMQGMKRHPFSGWETVTLAEAANRRQDWCGACTEVIARLVDRAAEFAEEVATVPLPPADPVPAPEEDHAASGPLTFWQTRTPGVLYTEGRHHGYTLTQYTEVLELVIHLKDDRQAPTLIYRTSDRARAEAVAVAFEDMGGTHMGEERIIAAQRTVLSMDLGREELPPLPPPREAPEVRAAPVPEPAPVTVEEPVPPPFRDPRNALRNFRLLSQRAPTESGRRYWSERADELGSHFE
ncbi:hypothetical protein [Streptomyces sp. NPDC050507]|uniref:hypothetical protein n=1 Tax=Streptomyces sp. NPDC050507 TaxID=3365619 RepID=UPI0037AC9E22